MILHKSSLVFVFTTLLALVLSGHSTLAASDLQTPAEILSIASDDLAFLQQITTQMSEVFSIADEVYKICFRDGRFDTADLVVDKDALTYVYAYHEYVTNVTSLNASFNLQQCDPPAHANATLQKWSIDDGAPTTDLIRTVLHAEKSRAKQCARVITAVEQTYTELQQQLRNELWNMPLWRHDFRSAVSCPTSLSTKEDSGARAVSTQSTMSRCHEVQQALTSFRNLEILAIGGWAMHIVQDTFLNFPQRFARLRETQLEISRSASIVATMDDDMLERDLLMLTEYCKTLRDRAMGSPTDARGGYTVSNWAADHVAKWTAWSEQLETLRAEKFA